jgi:hypothetical protein
MKIKYSIITLLASLASLHGQISGGLDLAPKPQASAKAQSSALKEIAVTSFGATPEGAEKRAISDAVRQAVGAYVDAKTITENDAVIKDRILSVSSGFVKEYKVTSPAQRTEDGLYQISMIAVVETNQVAAALKDTKIISGEVNGKSLSAESVGKLANAEDAITILNERFPEIYKSMIKVSLVDEKGIPKEDTNPISKKTDPKNKSVVLTWFLEISSDLAYYRNTVLPLFKNCIEAIAAVPAEKFHLSSLKDQRPKDLQRASFFNIGVGQLPIYEIMIVEDYTKSLDSIDGSGFKAPLQHFDRVPPHTVSGLREHSRIPPLGLKVDLRSKEGQPIVSKRFTIASTLRSAESLNHSFPALAEASIGIDFASSPPDFHKFDVCVISPFIIEDAGSGYISMAPKVYRAVSIEVLVDDLGEVSQVNFSVEVNPDSKVFLQSK